MARIARVVLTDTMTDSELDPFTFDLLLDPKGQVHGKAPTTGWWGNFAAGNDLLPFILLPNGKLDFGSDYEVDERYGTTNLHSKIIAVGEYVTVQTDGRQYCLRVTKLVWLDELN
jgi:hypothetical protein